MIFLLGLIQKELKKNKLNSDILQKILSQRPDKNHNLFRRSHLIAGYHYLVSKKLLKKNDALVNVFQMKPIRTQSGVTPVTVLTKPFPCPGTCIFCPNDVRMPKSYLAEEPGAQRALINKFDPYLQTYNRLLALKEIGHNVEKVELIILGGTWSCYPEAYQIWFVKRCFDAMNNFPHPSYPPLTKGGKIGGVKISTWGELEKAQEKNEKAFSRNVGLVLETRPDFINEKEVIKLRRFGATKIQIGIQSTSNRLLELNKRGHDAKTTVHAIKLLRLAGFKIHGHWMPNLFGATVADDIKDYKNLWTPEFSPDELKIYPTSIIANTELNKLYRQSKYKPYSYNELLKVFTHILPATPRFVRLTRIIRDIPSQDIVAGNKFTNFRQIAEREIAKLGKKLQDIRSREVKNLQVALNDLKIEILKYPTDAGYEYFISYKTKKGDKIAGFLRLTILKKKISAQNFISEIQNCAMIREVHVYGSVVGIGKKSKGKAQHLGLGTKLMEKAFEIAKKSGYKKIAVISAIGTREYYRKRGFKHNGMYLFKNL